MPSVLPTPETDYRAPPAPARMVLDRAVWDAVFGSVGGRLRALEDVNSGIEQLKLELQNFGIQRLDEAINPLIAQTQAALATLLAEVAEAQAELADTVENANAAFAAALATANTSLGQVQTQLNQMLAGGVPAANVALTAINTLAAANAQAAFAEIVSEMNTLAESTTTALTTISTTVAGKVDRLTRETKTASFNAVAGRMYLINHTAALTMTYPANPAVGDRIGFIIEDAAETFPVTWALSGKSFTGSTANVTISRGVTLITEFYDNAWRIVG